MHELHTDIEINASPERVWQILTDFNAFPSWNPGLRISGTPQVGSRLVISGLVSSSSGRRMTFRPTVLAAEAGRELRWLGRLFVPGLFDGEHAFLIEPLGPERVRFIQRERFTGLLVPLFTHMSLLADTRRGFVAMNEALKAHAEEPL